MNIIEWLLQTTSKGATYLQAITICTIGLILIIISIKEMISLFKYLLGGENNDKN